MRVSLRWLGEYVAISESPEELARRLTLSTVEIEAIERTHEWENVHVGHVRHVEPHPHSDHLRLCDVDTGDGIQRVVCGAPNVAPGQKIAFAAPGAKLIDPSTGELKVLKPVRIRNVDSNGMICSERELGLSDEHKGILELPADAPVGRALASYLGDTVLVAGAWAHRADLLSMLGIAREVAALTGEEVHPPELDYDTAGDVAERLSVTIEAPDLCARYVGGLIEGVTVGPSPDWLQQRLIAAGQRPINNVVDITNYVMLEYGQPLHAFDYERVADHHIIVRRGRAGERLRTLDGVERILDPEILVIADPSGPVALAGVMGGADSEVTEGTTSVLLEAANFSGTNIRRTSTRLALRSEASLRFEKQLPATLAELAARRAIQLMVRYAGGRACAGLADAYPKPQTPVEITLAAERLRRVLGIEIEPDEVMRTLRALGFECTWQPRVRQYTITVPYWRTDVSIPDDIIEEVIRIVGFERLPSSTIAGRIPAPLPQPQRSLRERVKDILSAAGGQEIITYSAVSEELLAAVVPADTLIAMPPLRVINPVSADHELLRTSLRGSMLETVAANLRLKRPSLSLFETGIAFLPRPTRTELPEERELLIGAICGRRTDRWGRLSHESLDFFDAKGYVEELSERLGLGLTYVEGADPNLLDGRTAHVQVANEVLGAIGEVHPDLLAHFGIAEPVFLYELDLSALLPHVRTVKRFTSISRFPAVEQDLALVVDSAVPAQDLLDALRRSRPVVDVRIFDEYTGDQVPEGKKSLAFAVAYQSREKTLTDEEVAREQRRLIEGLRRQFGAEPRA